MLQGVPVTQRSRKVRALLEDMGMSGLEHRKPGEMSGGQQQRIAVARAMVAEPVIILADEPTANLDSESSVNLLNLMRTFNETKGITFLFSSHDDRVIHLAKRIILLRDGKIESDGREKS